MALCLTDGAFLSSFHLLRNLNPENELKRYFGARAVLGDQRLVQNLILNPFQIRGGVSVLPLAGLTWAGNPGLRVCYSFSSCLLGQRNIFCGMYKVGKDFSRVLLACAFSFASFPSHLLANHHSKSFHSSSQSADT